MARFLICTHPITGHVNPPLEIARALVGRGHEVRFYTGRKFRAKVEATGAEFAPMVRAYDYDDSDYDAAFPGRSSLRGIKQITFDFKRLFIEPGPDQAEDLRDILRAWPADAVLSDPAFVGASILHEKGEIRSWAVFNISVLGLPSGDVPPFGLGMLPDYSPLGKVKNRLLTLVANKVVFREVNACLRQTLARVGLPPRNFAPIASPMLYLQPSVPAIEYPRSDLIPSAHFIGPVLPRFAGEFDPPAWWDDVVHATKPVVIVTQGTVATDASELVLPTLRALADGDVLVVATTGGKDLGEVIPANARVARFVPFDRLMPRAAAMVTNGGYGGVMFALANGVPVVCAGTTEDKPEVGNRMAYSGVGVNLRTNRPSEAQVRGAVGTVLADGRYRANARRIRAELARHDGPAEAAALLERLAATGRPVLRPEGELAWAGRTALAVAGTA
jgi:MGT family glycosyltransferase